MGARAISIFWTPGSAPVVCVQCSMVPVIFRGTARSSAEVEEIKRRKEEADRKEQQGQYKKGEEGELGGEGGGEGEEVDKSKESE